MLYIYVFIYSLVSRYAFNFSSLFPNFKNVCSIDFFYELFFMILIRYIEAIVYEMKYPKP